MNGEKSNSPASQSTEDMTNPRVIVRFIGGELVYDIGDETIREVDLRKWVWDHFPEDSIWRSRGGGIVAYHTRAYANRRRAIDEFMRALKW